MGVLTSHHAACGPGRRRLGTVAFLSTGREPTPVTNWLPEETTLQDVLLLVLALLSTVAVAALVVYVFAPGG